MKLSITHDTKMIKASQYIDLIKEYKAVIKKCIKYCLEEENIDTSNTIEIYIKYTNNDDIKEINKEYRNIDKATDVLSFPMYESDEVKCFLMNQDVEIQTLGDIIISIERVEQQAIEYEHNFQRELIYLITHAMFHLLGYDHIQDDDKKVMRKKEEKIMSILDISR